MNPVPAYLSVQPDSTILALKIQTRASRNAIAGPIGNELRVTLTAPPVDNAANDELVRFLAEQLKCSRSQIEITRGRTSRHKLVRVVGVPAELIAQQLSTTP
jgi:hypothetical protein